MTIPSVVRVTVLAVLCGLLSILFCVVMHGAGKLLKKAYPNQFVKILVCSAILINLTYLIGAADYNGAGMSLFCVN